MAGKALVGKEGPDVAVELKLVAAVGMGPGGGRQQNAGCQEPNERILGQERKGKSHDGGRGTRICLGEPVLLAGLALSAIYANA